MSDLDVVVIGGGPAGSVCAARLAGRGRHVLAIERARHPRFHLGESLLPASVPVLDAIGVLDAVRARFLVKRGARFVDGSDERPPVRYSFADAFQPRCDHAFQVPRDEFDEILFRRAGECGAQLREGSEVTRILFDGQRAHGVEVRAEDGTTQELPARLVVDASGRDAILPRKLGLVERVTHLDRTALFGQFRGAWRDDGEREGDVQIVVFGEGPERGWFWLIPFADGRTSAGAVVSSAWMRARQALGGPPALFEAAVRQTPAVARMLEGTESLFPPRATADFSFRTKAMHGQGWLALGDASGFIDPLFSTGAHLAMHGALTAADAIEEALATKSSPNFTAWEQSIRAGADLFLGTVQAFYSGNLTNQIFATPQHPFLRRSITSLLSGDVFEEDPLWRREIAHRYPPLP